MIQGLRRVAEAGAVLPRTSAAKRTARRVLAGMAWAGAATFGPLGAVAQPSALVCHRMAKVERCEGRLDHRTFESLLATVRMLGDGGTLRASLVMDKSLGQDPQVTSRFAPDAQILAWHALDSTDSIAIHGPLQRDGDTPVLRGCFRIAFAGVHQRGGDSTAQSWSWDLYPGKAC